MEPLQHPVVILHNTNLEDIRAVLSFIYRGHCLVSKEQLPSLLSVAKLLKIKGLCDMKVCTLCYKNHIISRDLKYFSSETYMLLKMHDKFSIVQKEFIKSKSRSGAEKNDGQLS